VPATETPTQQLSGNGHNYTWAAACLGILSHAECNRQRRLCDHLLE